MQSLKLIFSANLDKKVKSRYIYAARVFAAIYGYKLTVEAKILASLDNIEILTNDGSSITIPVRYSINDASSYYRFIDTVQFRDNLVPLFLGLDESSNAPDFLGELFYG